MTNLGDKIAELFNPAPKFKDKDDDFGIEACVDKYKPDYEDIEAAGRSQLRIRNFQPCLDKRYVGKKVSRRKLMSDSEDSDHDISNENVEGEEDTDDSKEDNSIYSEESEQSSDEDDDGKPNSDENRDTMDTTNCYSSVEENSIGSVNSEENSDDEEEENSDLDNEGSMIEKFSAIDVDEEVKKGKAVKAQLSLWDRILENRIKLQKLLVISNKLPQSDDYPQFFERGNEELRELMNKGHKSTKLLLDLLIELQTELLWRNNSTNYIISNNNNAQKESTDEEIPSDTEEEDDGKDGLKGKQKEMRHGLKRKLTNEEYPEFLAKRHKSFMPFRNGTIQKWNDKVKISSGKLTQNSFSAFDQSALKQIEQILNDRPRLIRKTQVKRSMYRILGKNEELQGLSDNGKEVLQSHHEKEYDTEIFDDDDFYHQLLRELIEKKIDINDPISLSRQWLEIQKLRKRMKKKVDTKASKGRKVRYDVIPKLVNFMASVGCSNAAEETVNELCRSLFKDSHQAGLYT